jgi:hypothetical protein
MLVGLDTLVRENLLYYFGQPDVPDPVGIIQQSLGFLRRPAFAIGHHRNHSPLIIDLQSKFILLDACIKLLFVLNVQIELGLRLFCRAAAYKTLWSGSYLFNPNDIFLFVRQLDLKRIICASFFFSHKFKNQLQRVWIKRDSFVKEFLCFSNFFCCLV